MAKKRFETGLELKVQPALDPASSSSITIGAKSNLNLYFKTPTGAEGMFWHSRNHGSGSGLDADLLDGQEGSYYAPATHYHDDRYSMLGHTHDSRYYTETEVNNLLSNYQPLDSDLTGIAALTGTGYLYRDPFTGWSLQTISGGDSYAWWELNGTPILGRNAGASEYREVTIQGGTGISVTNGTGNAGTYLSKILTITNSAPFPGFGTTSSLAARGNHTHTINSLSNVTISSPATNSLLAYNGSAWVNKTAAELGLGGGGSPTLRTFTWVIKNPTAGGVILGPKTYLNEGYIKRVTGVCVGGTSLSFSLQARTLPNTASSNLGTHVATTYGTNDTTNYYVSEDSHLALIIGTIAGATTQLIVTLAFEEV